MTKTISKWGNSCGVRLPADLLARKSWGVGTVLEFEETDRGVLVKEKAPRFSITLDEMLVGVTPENSRYDDVPMEWTPVGKEIVEWND